jgi:hypothetical protein
MGGIRKSPATANRSGAFHPRRNEGDLDRKEEIGSDRMSTGAQSIAVLRAFAVDRQRRPAVPEQSPSSPTNERKCHRLLLNRAGYHGYHVPHGFRAAFSTIMERMGGRNGRKHDRQIIDLMLAHVPKEKVRRSLQPSAAYMERRRELALIWANMLAQTLPPPRTLERPIKQTGDFSRRRIPTELSDRFDSTHGINQIMDNRSNLRPTRPQDLVGARPLYLRKMATQPGMCYK